MVVRIALTYKVSRKYIIQREVRDLMMLVVIMALSHLLLMNEVLLKST